MEHSNSRTFQGLSKTFKDLFCFQGLSRAWNFFQNSRTFKDLSRTPWTLISVQMILWVSILSSSSRGFFCFGRNKIPATAL